LPEKYYKDPLNGRLGSGRPDGSFVVGPEEEPYEFNTHDTWKDGTTPTAREVDGKDNLERLRELKRQGRAREGGSSKPGRFDMFPKSRNWPSRAEWERYAQQAIDELMNKQFGSPPE